MQLALATGIYPPVIGGPATYVEKFARGLQANGHEVTVITYGIQGRKAAWPIVEVSPTGGPLLRWWRYAQALRSHASDADAVIAFSSVSCGIPLWFARLKKPKKILRLGGDFFWERYTDSGGMRGLREWYAGGAGMWRMLNRFIMPAILHTFDHIIFSTSFQKEIYEKQCRSLPRHSVIENALEDSQPALHQRHDPFRLLFVGRFVPFKNLFALLGALASAPKIQLMLVGNGPLAEALRKKVKELELGDRVTFSPPVTGKAKQDMFATHDALILPSFTEISPHTALEARGQGLPVLLTQENGLSETMRGGMYVAPLKTTADVGAALNNLMEDYGVHAQEAAEPLIAREWSTICDEYLHLLSTLR